MTEGRDNKSKSVACILDMLSNIGFGLGRFRFSSSILNLIFSVDKIRTQRPSSRVPSFDFWLHFCLLLLFIVNTVL